MTTRNNMTLGELVPAGHETKLPPWALRLTERKLRFVQEYLVDRNGRAAAIRAGLTKSNDGGASVASQLLRDPEVRASLDEIWAGDLSQRLQLRDRIMEELSYVAFHDMGDYVSVRKNVVEVNDLDTLTVDQRKSIKRVKQTKGEKNESIEIEMHDKIKALDLLDSLNGLPRTPKGGTEPKVNIKDSNVQFVVSADEAKAL